MYFCPPSQKPGVQRVDKSKAGIRRSFSEGGCASEGYAEVLWGLRLPSSGLTD
jgi:hypothetical protein